MKTRLTVVAPSTYTDDMIVAIEEGVDKFIESRANDEPDDIIIWLHPDWEVEDDGEALDALMDEIPYHILFEDGLMGMDEIEIGTPDSVSGETEQSPAAGVAIPDAGNLWLGVQASNAGVSDIIEAAIRARDRFKEKNKIEPTHLSLHKSFLKVKDEIAEKTGLIPTTEPPTPYHTVIYVGVRQTANTVLKVKSTSVEEIEFYPDGDIGTLFVTFNRRGGKPPVTYQYDEVPTSVYDEMVAAPSKGAFVNEKLKGKYEHDIVSE